MYGIVNKVIKDYLVSRHGEAMWQEVKQRIDIDPDVFVLDRTHPDEVTYRLIECAADILNVSTRDLNLALGEHWVLETGLVNAGVIMRSAASDLKGFLTVLPNIHARVMLAYPLAKAPEFHCSNVTDHSLWLHYFSEREGLTDYMEGLLRGLGKFYETEIGIELIQSKADGASHDVFEVSWP